MKASGTLNRRARYLEDKAREIRAEILKMIHSAQSGHPGGSLSATDILAALYFDILNIRPEEPDWPDRDRFVLSKGHACPVWYATLALRGYFPVEELSTLRQFETRLQGHPVQGKCPGVDATTGSLGIGFGQAVGMALDARLRRADWNVYAVLGDGETNEGIVWEAAGTANKYHLDNLVAIVDRNNLQNDGTADKIMPMEPLEDKFRAFNWHTMRIDGHDMDQVLNALVKARDHVGKPVAIIADTVKGKGVSYMENVRGWHGTPPNDDQLDQALKDVGGKN